MLVNKSISTHVDISKIYSLIITQIALSEFVVKISNDKECKKYLNIFELS